MKLRWIPIVMTIAVSSIILFGGWFVYQSLTMKQPLHRVVQELPDVVDSQVEMNQKDVLLHLTLNKNANLRETIQYIRTEGASALGNKQLQIEVANESNETLDHWWSSVLFEVAQAMETRQYGMIPKQLAEQALQIPGLQTTAEMDEQNVYIRLVLGDDSKFIILPRHSVQLGVWK